MTDNYKQPEDCATMLDVRAGVDATDQAIMDLIERRYGYMRAAARIKPGRESVRDEPRKAAVIAAVRRRAEEAGLPAAEIAAMWEQLVESSIAYELVEWDRLRS